MNKILILLTTLLIVFLPSEAIEEENELYFEEERCEDFQSMSKTCAEVYARMTFGKMIGVDDSYSTMGVWAFREESDYLYFLDGRFHHISNGGNGLNVGTGIRFGDIHRGCGINLYYDWRNMHSTNLSQIQIGLEGWLCPWEYRFNAYIPLQSIEHYSQKKSSYPGDFVFHTTKTLYPCRMASLLMGRKFNYELCDCVDLYFTALAGPYWISNRKNRNRYGVLANIDLCINEIISLKTLFSYDPIFHSRTAGILVSLTIPFFCNYERENQCSKPLYYSIPERLDLIPVKDKTSCSNN
ncbi:MAG: inverse autotransporter beta domain-containing protein [Parachlamydiales bacterium]|jgi:hypothetical protein